MDRPIFKIQHKRTKEIAVVVWVGINGNWYLKEKTNNYIIPYRKHCEWEIIKYYD